MPKIDFTDMPYEKEYSTGEHVRRNAFYLPDETIEESDEIYRGYHTIVSTGSTGVCVGNPILVSDKTLKTNEYCDKCPNNPSNGGSGVCHCILGQPTYT